MGGEEIKTENSERIIQGICFHPKCAQKIHDNQETFQDHLYDHIEYTMNVSRNKKTLKV